MEDSLPLITDESLVTRVVEGDTDAFGLLMKRYTPKLMRYGSRFLSRPENIEDIVQDVFLKTYQNLQSFDLERKFSPWIYRIAHNEFVNALRKTSKEPIPVFDLDLLSSHPVHEDQMEERKEQEADRVLVEKGVETLSAAYREIVTLHYFEDLSYQEIAEVLHIPLGTVGVRLRRAREALKKQLSAELSKQTL